jgi:hybrid cluster-associated redox disulfide protein
MDPQETDMRKTRANLGELHVATIMRQWPDTILVFLEFKMLCVGCPFASFHTLASACDLHPVRRSQFSRRLEETITDAAPTHAPSEDAAD